MAVKDSFESLRAVLDDFDQAARCFPGLEEVKQIGDGLYEGTMRLRIGPMGLTLTGTLELQRDEKEGRWRMHAQAQDRKVGGGVRANIEATLTGDEQGGTRLDVASDIQPLGRLGGLVQPIMKQKADSLLQEFVKNLQRAARGRMPRITGEAASPS